MTTPEGEETDVTAEQKRGDLAQFPLAPHAP